MARDVHTALTSRCHAPTRLPLSFYTHVQGSVAWGGKGTCDVPVDDNNYSHYPFRIMDIDLACDCLIDQPTCNTGDFELRTPPGILLPQPLDCRFVLRARGGGRSITSGGSHSRFLHAVVMRRTIP